MELTFGSAMPHMMQVFKHHNIEPNCAELQQHADKCKHDKLEEVKEMQKATMMRCKPSDEILNAMQEEAKAFGKVKYERDGTMKWEDFKTCSMMSHRYVISGAKEGLKKYKGCRRAAMAASDIKQWDTVQAELARFSNQ